MDKIIMIKPNGIIPQNKTDKWYKKDKDDVSVIPNVFKADSKPCLRWEAIKRIETIYKQAVKVWPKKPNLFCYKIE